MTSVGIVTARAVVLATGGYGQVFASTSNPPAVTGDGLALAAAGRAAAARHRVRPVPSDRAVARPDATGQQALISEAVRGEGAILFDGLGRRVMAGVHPLEDLAPRDVVAAAITGGWPRRRAAIGDHVFLDATAPGRAVLRTVSLDHRGVPRRASTRRRERIPVAPAAHYVCGGVVADLDGRTELAGLFAVGEVPARGCTGPTGWPPTALTEGVVAGTRLGRDLAANCRHPSTPERRTVSRLTAADQPGRTGSSSARRCRATSACCAARGALAQLSTLSSMPLVEATTPTSPSRRAWEATNLLTVAAAVVGAAQRADREPRLPPPHRLDRPAATCGSPTSTSASTLPAARRGGFPEGA